jgi:hypothetical protein
MWKHIFSRENLYAVGLALLIIVLVIVTSDSTPAFIYEGF